MTVTFHDVITNKPWCGDCGKTRSRSYCPDCCYPVCDQCIHRHS